MKDKYGRDINYLKVHLTDECNLNCIYCYLDKENKRNDLSLNQYKVIIKYMAEVGIKKIKFTGGEPTLYPYLNELIYFCKNDCGINDISNIQLMCRNCNLRKSSNSYTRQTYKDWYDFEED